MLKLGDVMEQRHSELKQRLGVGTIASMASQVGRGKGVSPASMLCTLKAAMWCQLPGSCPGAPFSSPRTAMLWGKGQVLL